MTHDEKRVLKELGKMISELAYLVGVYEAVLKRHVKDWREEVAVANATPAFQSLRREIDSRQQSIESLIDENNLSALLTKLAKGSLVN
jgi:hypothetical protein